MKNKLYHIKEYLNDLFEVSRSERNGLVVLTVCISLVITYNFSVPYWHKQPRTDHSALTSETEEWLAKTLLSKSKNTPTDSELLLDESLGSTPYTLFSFNPNIATEDEFEKLGFSQRQIQTIKKYLKRGGSFKIKSDFAKLYFMTPERFEELLPFIELPESYSPPIKDKTTSSTSLADTKVLKTKEKEESSLISKRVELNSADTIALKKLKGIGSYRANNIIQYRNRLGGFVSVDQLREVRSFDIQLLDELRPLLIVDTGLVKKIHLNRTTAKELTAHPYITSSQARSIIAYRETHGQYKVVADIRRSILIDENTYEKIKEYLIID